MISDHWRDNLKAVPRDRITLDPSAQLADWCQSNHVPYADVPASLRSAGSGSYYLPGDSGHLNPAGSTLAAQVISKTLPPILVATGEAG